jgi:hypothetical protein
MWLCWSSEQTFPAGISNSHILPFLPLIQVFDCLAMAMFGSNLFCTLDMVVHCLEGWMKLRIKLLRCYCVFVTFGVIE